MGCDIYAYVEFKKNNSWRCYTRYDVFGSLNDIDLIRWYAIFAAM